MNVKNVIFLCALLPLLSMLLPLPGGAAAETISNQNDACLACHAKQDIVISFQNNESLSGHVDVEKLKASAHGELACSACHIEFASAQHPKRIFRSREQFTVRASLVCRRCHSDEQLKARPVHVELLERQKAGAPAVCADCHGAHSVIRVTRRKSLNDDAKSCLSCHRRPIRIAFQKGEAQSYIVDATVLEGSVHNKLSCADCHYGFSRDEHPKRQFRSPRDMTIASAESCRRCHFDKYSKFQDSIHYTKLSQGFLKAPVCTDCHGHHSISSISKERIVSANRCRKCHPDIYDTYAKSVHGNALVNEFNQDVPVCVDCHTTHDIQNPHSLEFRERVPQMCSSCHANKGIMGKYGLSTDVMKTYLSDFHGVTLGFYIKQKNLLPAQAKGIAVCTDCHGTHNITSTVSPDATTVKANLVQRCRKCHANATENFPDAWISHYKPSLKRAPLLFVITILYKFLTPLIILGLVLQILLHIWRYAVSR
ncbi:MAG TPA: cytochrome c3 family protein [Nitrospirota bacterium]|nr:cytochrome c3 family protein [Nitrospirota bacterium]